MTEKRIISVDSQILNSIQACHYKTKLVFLDNYQTIDKPEAMEKGSLIHDMFQVYYELKGPRKFQTSVWKDLREQGFLTSHGNWNALDPTEAHDAIVQFACDVGIYTASKMNIDQPTAQEVIFQFKEYTKFYRHDTWQPLAVEEVGTKILYEDNEVIILYTFKIDLVADNGRYIAPFDHKTSSRRSTPTSLSNQFIGYCFGINKNHIVVNKIGFQKTLKPEERFQRYPLFVSNERIEEWRKNAIEDIFDWDTNVQRGVYKQNLTSCDKYAGCIFRGVCESDPSVRAGVLNAHFRVGDKWDPAKELENE